MRRESWSYKVYAELTLDRREIEVLTAASETHYDAKCRAASRPGPGAFINGFRNMIDEDEGTSTSTVSQDQIDTMLKILEMSRHLPEDEAKVGIRLSLELRRLFHEMSGEWRRLNRGDEPGANDAAQPEIALWRSVLAHPSAVGLDYAGGMLSARRNEDGSFEIDWEREGADFHKAFVASDVDGAARFFAEKRMELEYGEDFEIAAIRRAAR